VFNPLRGKQHPPPMWMVVHDIRHQ